MASRSGTSSGAALILVATAIAGVAGYLVTFLVYRVTGPAPYAVFAVFWASTYLLVGGLSGVQQEIARATELRSADGPAAASRARTFGIGAAVAIAVVIFATAPLWHSRAFGSDGWALVLPLAVGVASYVLVATLAGSLYGISQVRSVGLMVIVDSLLRLALVGAALAAGLDAVWLAWAVALPFPLTMLLLWPIVRGGVVGRTSLDVGLRRLSYNVGRTVAGSLSTAVLVSGFPLLVGVAGASSDAALVGELVFAITLTRAPLIVTVMSLQSFLVVRFRDSAATARRLLLMLCAGIAGGVIVLGVAGAVVGPSALTWASGHPTHLDGAYIALLVISSGVVGMLCVLSAAVLARGAHAPFAAGWLVAALVTVVAMALPVGLLSAVAIAVTAGPVAGVIVLVTWLLVAGRVADGGVSPASLSH